MNFKNVLPGCMFAAALCLTLPVDVVAVDLSATEITSIDGRVEVRKGVDAAFKKLNSNLKLSGALKRLDGGDKVRTFTQSSAEMALKETCMLAVKEQSIFEVPKTLGKEAIAELKAQQGALLFKVISGSNFQVQTADVIAGVKGTLFEVDIIDNFHCLLETPGLQIGTLAAGGTMINVYKGEVELTHAQTGKKRTVKEGQGIAALGNSLLGIDKILEDGFTPLRNFDPATLLGEKFGNGALGLLTTNPTLSGLTEFAGIGGIQQNLGENRFSEMLSGLGEPLIQKLQAVESATRQAGEVIDQVKELERLGRDLVGEEFKADFSDYTPEERPFSVTDRNFREIYLGESTFAACKAGVGSQIARLEPNREGLLLNEGNSMFKLRKYNNYNTVVEFVASYMQDGSKLITTVKSFKGDLYGRIPGDIKFFKIPAGEMSYVYDPTSSQGKWMQAAAGAFDPNLTSHIMKIEEKIAKEKGQHDQETKEKQVDAVKKVIKNPRDLLRRFKF